MSRTFVDDLADDYLNFVVGRAASNLISTSAAARYLAAFTTAPAGDPTRSISNASLIAYAEATASWGTIVAVGIYDAASGGNLLDVITLNSSVLVDSGITFYFPVGALDISLS